MSILLFYVVERQGILVILLARNSTSSLFFYKDFAVVDLVSHRATE